MITIGLAGATGRMGQAITTELLDAQDLRLEAAISRTSGSHVAGHPAVLTTNLWSDAPKVDVILDVSLPSGTRLALEHAVSHSRPFVTGVTGIPDDLTDLLRAASGSIPVLVTSNFSLGVAALLRLLPLLSAGLASTDVAMIDVHHRAKKDAPSGTGRLLLDAINAGRPERDQVPTDAIQSVRIGGNPGEHSITFAAMGEEVTVIHRALNRSCYAAGALSAVRWIYHQPPGLYGMGNITP